MKNIVIIPLVILLFGSLGANAFLYQKYQKAIQLATNPEMASQEEVKSITRKVASLMELPTDEMPTIATVLDKDKLKDQQFFAKAENGDKIIIFSKNQKAILYRSSSNKIIEVAPISISEPETQTQDATNEDTSTSTPTPTTDPTQQPTPTDQETPSE